ncbi:DJ-1/PfpI family protein [Chlorogloea sp. CCALA 695]|uniref:DJ-1/PfpI family protein n=1 Tax=Chlorogloea sp. CCALA 695 TaxID=2107693 RepID=UPI0018ED4431|nr:DJ-1/PfpI family protein [Chlorogloea sp. CCALA 695]
MPEKEHAVQSAHFELGKVEDKGVRERMVNLFNHVDHELAKKVAMGIGISEPTQSVSENHGKSSAALSQENTTKTAKGRKVAILATDGINGEQITAVKTILSGAGVEAEIVSKFKGMIKSAQGEEIMVDKTFLTSASVLFDAIYVPGGAASIEALLNQGDAIHFINEAFRHCKPIAAMSEGVELVQNSNIKGVNISDSSMQNDKGVITAKTSSAPKDFAKSFVEAISEHRFWMSEQKDKVPG